MKATKKIVGAACALVAAVALSAGSTFAWFATNTSVSASGLNISVNTNSSFLLIGNSTTDTAAEIRALGDAAVETTFQAACPETGLKPVAHEAITNDADVKKANATDGVWYTQIADKASESASSGAKTKITALGGYVLVDVLHFTVKEGSGDTGALTVETVSVDKAESVSATEYSVKPVSVIFTCGTSNLVEFKNNGTEWVKQGDSNVLADKVTDVTAANATTATSVVTVNVYVYYDGAHGDVFTNNALKLVDATVSATFQVAEATVAGGGAA